MLGPHRVAVRNRPPNPATARGPSAGRDHRGGGPGGRSAASALNAVSAASGSARATAKASARSASSASRRLKANRSPS